MEKTVDSIDAAEVVRLVAEGETVSLIAMLVVALSAEMVLLSTKNSTKTFYKAYLYQLKDCILVANS